MVNSSCWTVISSERSELEEAAVIYALTIISRIGFGSKAAVY